MNTTSIPTLNPCPAAAKPCPHPRSHQRQVRTRVLCCLAFALFAALPARAEESAASARADALFRTGKQQLSQGDLEAACPALSESVRLEKATGALLALALCHERQGKLASAYREYSEAAVRAQTEHHAERERGALQKATELRWKVSTLAFTGLPAISGLTISLDGVPLEAASAGVPVPVDGGSLLIEASAPGHKSWSTTVDVAVSEGAQTLEIPALETLPAPVVSEALAPPPAAIARAPRAGAEPERAPLSGMQWTGVGFVGAGVVAALAGGILVLRAASKKEDSKDGCKGNLCTLDARRERLYARDAGNAATITFIAAAATGITGLVLYWAGGQRSESAAEGGASVWVSPHGTGASIAGRF